MTIPTPAQVEAVAKAMFFDIHGGSGFLWKQQPVHKQNEFHNMARAAILAWEQAKEKA